MISITISSSMRVKPRRADFGFQDLGLRSSVRFDLRELLHPNSESDIRKSALTECLSSSVPPSLKLVMLSWSSGV